MLLTNLTKSKIDEKLLLAVDKKAAVVLGDKKLIEVSLVICGEQKIKAINKKYRGQNRVTDVLSFEDLNEIFICLPRARQQAKALKHSLNCELTRLFVHGIVHLKGYDHEKSTKEAERMFEIEEKILKAILKS